ncbi:MAG: beta-ketoacyl synthase chain length factor [Campylobacteraceae bacterium]|nr:beta-ketoacyl synthase chain length factor [Campylobacteraceae bacterium]
MKINLKILDASYLYGENEISSLNTKKIVPKMMQRRRLTKASKLLLELMNNIRFTKGRIIYGTAFGELLATSKILKSILNEETVSPTDFQNSVYNTAVSYASILHNNEEEILTISSGDRTSLSVLKVAAVKAMDNDELLLLCSETINIENIDVLNKCQNYLECAVALRVKITQEEESLFYKTNKSEINVPISMRAMLNIAMNFKKSANVIGVEV